MKSFDEFVNEKFDYRKQIKYENDFMELKPGDSLYFIHGSSTDFRDVEKVRDIKIDGDVIKVHRYCEWTEITYNKIVKFEVEYCYKDMGLMIFDNGWFQLVSTNEETAILFRKKCGEKYIKTKHTKENVLKLIKDFKNGKL